MKLYPTIDYNGKFDMRVAGCCVSSKVLTTFMKFDPLFAHSVKAQKKLRIIVINYNRLQFLQRANLQRARL